MFLFKNSKNKVTRIGLNLLVYSFSFCFVLFLAIPLFTPIQKILGVLFELSSITVFIGLFMTIVGSFLPARSQKQNKHGAIVSQEKIIESSSSNNKARCVLCGDSSSSKKIFNGKTYCYLCFAEYSSKFYLENGILIDKDGGGALLKEVILCKKPLDSCRGNVEPTDFIIRIYNKKVEVKWGVGWQGGSSHADGAGNSEILDADYFETHTIHDFVAWFEERGWGKDFVKWFDIANNPKIRGLFSIE